MPISEHFYHGTTRKYVVLMGTLFNGITVHRKDGKIITVPLTYASKEKFYLRLAQNPDLSKEEAIDLPRIGFILSDMMYEPERKQPSLGKVTEEKVDDSMHRKSMYLPVPYDFIFEVSVYVRNVDDGLQILEQIIPFFKPSFNVTINELDDMGIVRDIPIVLDMVSGAIEDEGEFTQQRVVRWDMNFTLKGNFYGPKSDQAIIKKVYVDYYTSQDGEYLNSIDERYRVAVDPETARPEDIWIYDEELISSHDSTNTEIPDVETDILERQFAIDTVYFTDYATAEIV